MKMEIEKTDWERIKQTAEAQIKEAMISLRVNQVILDDALTNIKGYKNDDNKENITTPDNDIKKET